MERIAYQLEQQFGVSVAVDLLGSGLISPSTSSFLEAIVYMRCSGERMERILAGHEGFGRTGCDDMMPALQAAFESLPDIRVADWIDLDRVIRALHCHDYECDVTQRFVAYRTIGLPVYGSAVALVEQLLNKSPAYRSEIEGTGCAYLEIFRNLAIRVKNMKVFDARLRELGITAPQAFKQKIEAYFHGRNET